MADPTNITLQTRKGYTPFDNRTMDMALIQERRIKAADDARLAQQRAANLRLGAAIDTSKMAPKHAGYVNSQVQDLYKKVEDGLDPSSAEFTRELARIQGEAGQFASWYTDFKANGGTEFMKNPESQVVPFLDEQSGTSYNVSRQAHRDITNALFSQYNPDQDDIWTDMSAIPSLLGSAQGVNSALADTISDNLFKDINARLIQRVGGASQVEGDPYQMATTIYSELPDTEKDKLKGQMLASYGQEIYKLILQQNGQATADDVNAYLDTFFADQYANKVETTTNQAKINEDRIKMAYLNNTLSKDLEDYKNKDKNAPKYGLTGEGTINVGKNNYTYVKSMSSPDMKTTITTGDVIDSTTGEVIETVGNFDITGGRFYIVEKPISAPNASYDGETTYEVYWKGNTTQTYQEQKTVNGKPVVDAKGNPIMEEKTQTIDVMIPASSFMDTKYAPYIQMLEKSIITPTATQTDATSGGAAKFNKPNG